MTHARCRKGNILNKFVCFSRNEQENSDMAAAQSLATIKRELTSQKIAKLPYQTVNGTIKLTLNTSLRAQSALIPRTTNNHHRLLSAMDVRKCVVCKAVSLFILLLSAVIGKLRALGSFICQGTQKERCLNSIFCCWICNHTSTMSNARQCPFSPCGDTK